MDRQQFHTLVWSGARLAVCAVGYALAWTPSPSRADAAAVAPTVQRVLQGQGSRPAADASLARTAAARPSRGAVSQRP